MPTFRLWGLALVQNSSGTPTAALPAWLDLVTTAANPTFSYTLDPASGEFAVNISVSSGTVVARADSDPFVTPPSFTFGPEALDASVTEVLWGGGQVTRLFGLEGAGPGGQTVFFVFRLDGAPLPGVTLADIAAFEAAIQDLRAITNPAFGPGVAIPVATLPGVQRIADVPAGDVLTADTTPDTIVGGDDSDSITGSTGNDLLQGGDGNDQIAGGLGNDVLGGQAGDDLLFGGAGNDTIAASDGNDFVMGGDGNDSVGGGLGSDHLIGGEGNDTLLGGPGNDVDYGGAGDDFVSGGLDNDTLYGGDGRDNHAAGPGNDAVYGGEGNDTIGGGDGNDLLDGGGGDDLFFAGPGNDTLLGQAGNDTLNGGFGNDMMFGGEGADLLVGGPGSDRMNGGGGPDVFEFTSYTSGALDVIEVFENGVDRLRLALIPGATAAEKFAALGLFEVADGVAFVRGGNRVVIEGVTLADMDVSDFVFI